MKSNFAFLFIDFDFGLFQWQDHVVPNFGIHISLKEFVSIIDKRCCLANS